MANHQILVNTMKIQIAEKTRRELLDIVPTSAMQEPEFSGLKTTAPACMLPADIAGRSVVWVQRCFEFWQKQGSVSLQVGAISYLQLRCK